MAQKGRLMPAGRQVPGLPSIWVEENIYYLYGAAFSHTAYLTVGDNTGQRSSREINPLIFLSRPGSALPSHVPILLPRPSLRFFPAMPSRRPGSAASAATTTSLSSLSDIQSPLNNALTLIPQPEDRGSPNSRSSRSTPSRPDLDVSRSYSAGKGGCWYVHIPFLSPHGPDSN